MLLLLLTVAPNLPLFAAMVLAAGALIGLQKRDTTPYLRPTLISSGGENLDVPAGLLHVHCLAAMYRALSFSSEG
jgi:hypothetical protein